MRVLPAILLTGCAVLVVATSFLPWGFLKLPSGLEISYNGWHEPLSIGSLSVPNWLVSSGVSLSAVLVWLRAVKIVTVPWILPLLLTSCSSGLVAWFCWFFSSGQAINLSGPPALRSWVGSGAYLAALGCATAFVVCGGMLVLPQQQEAPNR
jgi:hypothetical protein